MPDFPGRSVVLSEKPEGRIRNLSDDDIIRNSGDALRDPGLLEQPNRQSASKSTLGLKNLRKIEEDEYIKVSDNNQA